MTYFLARNGCLSSLIWTHIYILPDVADHRSNGGNQGFSCGFVFMECGYIKFGKRRAGGYPRILVSGRDNKALILSEPDNYKGFDFFFYVKKHSSERDKKFDLVISVVFWSMASLG